MAALLAVFAALAGVVLVGVGCRRWFRARFRTVDPALAARRRRGSRVVVGTGGALALAPDLIAALAGPTGGTAVLVAIVCLVWTGVVLALLGGVAVTMLLAGERVTRAARTTTERVVRAVPVPRRWSGRPAGTGALPREWTALVELDRELGRRLLRYQRDLDAGSAHPVMTDPADPHTRAAVEAMLRCDELRTPTPPRAWQDVRATPYAAAVARFSEALDAAEANSRRLVRSGVTAAEHAAIERAVRRLALLRDQATSPAERRGVYEQLVAEFAELDGTTAAAHRIPPVPASGRSHPWLDVDQRAGLR